MDRDERIKRIIDDIKSICEALEPGSITGGTPRSEPARDCGSSGKESSAGLPSNYLKNRGAHERHN